MSRAGRFRKKFWNKRGALGAALILIVLAGAGAWWWHGRQPLPAPPEAAGTEPTISEAPPALKPGPARGGSRRSGTGSGNPQAPAPPAQTPEPGPGLSPPTVSSSPTGTAEAPLSQSQAMSSTCQAPGYTACQIKLTRTSTGQVVLLPAKAPGSSGDASWSWTPSEYGLGGGQWVITSIASVSGTSQPSSNSVTIYVAHPAQAL